MKKQNPTTENIFEKIIQKTPQLVFIDNFDLITREKIRNEDFGRGVSKDIMNFTNDNEIPIIVLHHINKSTDTKNINSIRGSGKITDDVDCVMICDRELDAIDELTPEEAAKFTLIEKKDRSFGEPSVHNFYFVKGTFVDYFNKLDEFDGFH